MENEPRSSDFPINTSIYRGCSIAMFDETRWYFRQSSKAKDHSTLARSRTMSQGKNDEDQGGNQGASGDVQRLPGGKTPWMEDTPKSMGL